MLFYTGIIRTAQKVAKSYVPEIQTKEKQLFRLYDMVEDAIKILNEGSLDDFGHLLNDAWEQKRSLSDLVTNQEVDEIYSSSIAAGALGGKLSGAGGGGFLLLYVPKEKQAGVKKALSQLLHVPFRFESNGSQIIFFDQHQEYKEEEIAYAQHSHSPFVELKNLK